LLTLSLNLLSSGPTVLRAQIVIRIFEEAISGIGGYTIARRLNEEGVPSPKWNQSTINNLLHSGNQPLTSKLIMPVLINAEDGTVSDMRELP
jgi:hypothetical protein